MPQEIANPAGQAGIEQTQQPAHVQGVQPAQAPAQGGAAQADQGNQGEGQQQAVVQPAANLLADKPAGTPEPGKAGAEGQPAQPTEADFTVKLPEGFAADTAAIDVLKGMVKEGSLSKDAAQRLADTHAESVQRLIAKHQADWQTKIDGWENEIRANQEFGGPNLEKNVDSAKNVLRKYGSPKLVEEFKGWGALSYPEFAYMLMRIARDVSDGETIVGAGHALPENDPAKILFPDFK